MGVIGRMGLIFYRVCVLTCYRTYVLTASRPFDASTLRQAQRPQAQGPQAQGPYTGCGCCYWPRSGVHRRFWVGDGRPTAAGVAYYYNKALRR